MAWPRRMALGVVGLIVACGDSTESRDDGASGVPLTVTSAGGTSDADAGDTDKLDVPVGDGTGMGDDGGSVEGCQKVDFLFVIDSSRSMQDEQDNLLTSFPGFIAAIESTLEIDDFQLMVVDAGLVAGVGCDGTLGAGQVRSAAGQDCMITGGQRYATSAQADLVSAFTCMGSRGYMGSGDEQTMDSLLASVGPLSAAGQCNEGFVRDDAILVVTIITDEEDSPLDSSVNPPLDGSCAPADADPNSAGDPGSWAAELVAVKGGDPDAVVVLSLVGDCDVAGSCPGIAVDDPLDPLSPVTGAEPAPRLRAFTEMFEHGSVGPVCAADYAPFFEAAVAVIESACDDFVPQG
ncbi:MAG: hypothetical protein KDK70_37850 [Myxococcales bacterium]|nr:hypothetical protein [Myxococcales bacterium]